jgi:hypothetical protein
MNPEHGSQPVASPGKLPGHKVVLPGNSLSAADVRVGNLALVHRRSITQASISDPELEKKLMDLLGGKESMLGCLDVP